VFTHALFNDISNVLERWRQLLELVVAKSDVVGDVTLVTSDVERLLELALSILILFLLVEDTALGDDSFGRVGRHASDQRFGMRNFFQLVLDVNLELKDPLSVVRMIDLLGHL